MMMVVMMSRHSVYMYVMRVVHMNNVMMRYILIVYVRMVYNVVNVLHLMSPLVLNLLSFCSECLFNHFATPLGLFYIRCVGNFIDIIDYVFEFWF